MTEVAVLVPVLDRPHRAQPLADSFAANTPADLARLLFVCTPGDLEQIHACHATGHDVLIAEWPAGPGDYSRKINLGARATSEPWIFTGADDLRFHDGWASEALHVGESLGMGMVGTDDMGNGLVRQGRHSTHSLFRREYVEQCGTIDEPGLIYHEGYGHQHVDVEAYETAVARGCFAFAPLSRVEHLHFLWNKGEHDATYAKGMSSSDADRALYERRKHLWIEVAA